MGLFERYDAAGDKVERAFTVEGTDRDAQVRAWAAAGLHGWTEASETAAPAAPSRPAKSGVKGEWVEWAVSQGADRAEAEKATKDDLIAAYGESSEPKSPEPSQSPDPSGDGEE